MTGAEFLAAICLALAAESAGPSTVRDGGRAVGWGQTWPCAVAEANRIMGRPVWTLADRADIQAVEDMMGVTFRWHLSREPGLSVVDLACKWQMPSKRPPARLAEVCARHRRRVEAIAERWGVR